MAVLNGAGSQHAAVLAPYLSAAEGITLAATHPERVSHLVILNGAARLLIAPDYPYGLSPDRFDAFVREVVEPVHESAVLRTDPGRNRCRDCPTGTRGRATSGRRAQGASGRTRQVGAATARQGDGGRLGGLRARRPAPARSRWCGYDGGARPFCHGQARARGQSLDDDRGGFQATVREVAGGPITSRRSPDRRARPPRCPSSGRQTGGGGVPTPHRRRWQARWSSSRGQGVPPRGDGDPRRPA